MNLKMQIERKNMINENSLVEELKNKDLRDLPLFLFDKTPPTIDGVLIKSIELHYKGYPFWIEDNYLNFIVKDTNYQKSLQEVISHRMGFKAINFFENILDNHDFRMGVDQQKENLFRKLYDFMWKHDAQFADATHRKLREAMDLYCEESSEDYDPPSLPSISQEN